MTAFQLSALPHEPFERFFAMTDAALARRGAMRVVATDDTGFPCRVTLDDAARGDALLLLPFAHHPVRSPYRASGPIFVRRGRPRRVVAVDEVPPSIARRLLSVRAYDAAALMIDASVCAGDAVAAELAARFDDPSVAYVHLHFATRGCFACRVDRAGAATRGAGEPSSTAPDPSFVAP